MSGFASFANIVSNNLAGHQPAQSWMLSCSRSLYSTARLFLFRFQTLHLLLQFDEICLILSLKRIDRPRRFVVAFNSRIYPQIGHVLPTQKRVHMTILSVYYYIKQRLIAICVLARTL